jgi:glutathione peroxidase-family protein
MPEIEAVYQKYQDKGLVVVGIDMQESANTVRQFVQQGKFSWTFAIAPDSKVPANYRVFAIPTSFFIDKEGNIRESYIGQMTQPQMEKFIDEVIK